MYTIERLALIHIAVTGYDVDRYTLDLARSQVSIQEADDAERAGIRFGATFGQTYDSAKRLGLVGEP